MDGKVKYILTDSDYTTSDVKLVLKIHNLKPDAIVCSTSKLNFSPVLASTRLEQWMSLMQKGHLIPSEVMCMIQNSISDVYEFLRSTRET